MWGTKGCRCLCALMLGALLLGASGCAGTGRDLGEAKLLQELQMQETTYNTVTLVPQDLARTADLSADPSYRLVKSARLKGEDARLVEVCVGRNEHVTEGQVIAVLQGLGSQADVAQKELEIASYEASCREMSAFYQSLVDAAKAQSAATEAERELRQLRIELAETDLALYQLQAEAGRKGLEASLEALRRSAGEILVLAPMDGVVRTLDSRYKPGDVVPAGHELCSIYDEDSLLLFAQTTGGSFIYNREVTVTYGRSGSEKTMTGRVVSSPEVAPAFAYSNGVFVRVDEPEAVMAERNFKGSMQVHYTMLTDVLVVPKSALSTENGKVYVTLLEGDSTIKRSVVRGPMLGSSTSVLQGLEPGDVVVVSSYHYSG